jgi:hypothetical protein
MKNQKGNVLFLILIAVALFAALSYAVTQSSRTSSSGVDQDKAKLLASEIIGYASSVEQAISRIRVINRVPDFGIDVFADTHVVGSSNTNCTDNSCRLFTTVGGNVTPKLLNQDAWDKSNAGMATWVGRMYFRSLRVANVGSDAPDLLMMYPGVSEIVCAAINDRLGISNDSDGTAPNDGNGANGTNFINYEGALTSFPTPPATTDALGDEATQIVGQRTFCVNNGDSNGFYFWHVVIAR